MLRKLREASRARQLEWDGAEKCDALFFAVELAGECGELCNVVKKLERARRGVAGKRASVADLAEELADVVIVADLVASSFGVDLEEAVAKKFNATSEKLGLASRIDLEEEK